MPRFFTAAQLDVVASACERLIPRDDQVGAPGALAADVARYIDGLLGAFTFDPPRIWAGGPFSGRHGGDAGFEQFLALDELDQLAWRIRIEGSLGLPEREINGPHVGWQERYVQGLRDLGGDFTTVDPQEQDRRLEAAAEFRSLLYIHACEGMYGDPVYGGNRDGVGWRFIAFEGDRQPVGFDDAQVTEPRP